jgi:hypothetical protein
MIQSIICKIICTQVLILVLSFAVMHPSSHISTFLVKKFGNYTKILDYVMGFQLTLIAILVLCLIWTI